MCWNVCNDDHFKYNFVQLDCNTCCPFQINVLGYIYSLAYITFKSPRIKDNKYSLTNTTTAIFSISILLKGLPLYKKTVLLLCL